MRAEWEWATETPWWWIYGGLVVTAFLLTWCATNVLLVAMLCVMTIAGLLMCLTLHCSLRQLLAGVAVIGFLLSVGTSSWPLKLRYALSRPAFERLAARLEADGENSAPPQWVGLCYIQRIERRKRDGTVCLWMYDAPSGPAGFVRCPPEHPPFNIARHIPMDERWQFIDVD